MAQHQRGLRTDNRRSVARSVATVLSASAVPPKAAPRTAARRFLFLPPSFSPPSQRMRMVRAAMPRLAVWMAMALALAIACAALPRPTAAQTGQTAHHSPCGRGIKLPPIMTTVVGSHR